MRSYLSVAIGFAAIVTGHPSAFSQDVEVLDQTKSAECRSDENDRQAKSVDGLTVESQPYAGVFVEPPVGTVRVGPQFVDGDPVYVRRTTGIAGATVVEISTSPFMLDVQSNEPRAEVRPDQPASW